MNFTGNEKHLVSLQEAAEYTARYRKKNNITLHDTKSVRGAFFSKIPLLKLINQEGAVGFRYYYGLMEDGMPCLVLTAVTSANVDMVNGILMEFSIPCPPDCPDKPSILNFNQREIDLLKNNLKNETSTLFYEDTDRHYISMEEAAKYTARFRKANNITLADKKTVKGGFFGKTDLLKLLSQENCVGIRFYYGLTDEEVPCMVLAATDKYKNDIIENGLFMEFSFPCPPDCDNYNLLNSDIAEIIKYKESINTKRGLKVK